LDISISDIKADGAELLFIVFPVALNLIPWGNLWAVIFFFMMINLGLDTIMAYVEYISSLFE
jgi:SNF family Na+-dependent transporter